MSTVSLVKSDAPAIAARSFREILQAEREARVSSAQIRARLNYYR